MSGTRAAPASSFSPVDLAAETPMPVIILECRLIQKGSVIASLKIKLGKLVMHDVLVLYGSGKAWAGSPSKPQIGRDGFVIKDANGKTRYAPVIEWADKGARDRFSAGVIQAFERQHGPIAALVGGAT